MFDERSLDLQSIENQMWGKTFLVKAFFIVNLHI